MFTRRIFGFLCTAPQFRLFFNSNRQQHIQGLQSKVFELRTLYKQAADPQNELQYLNELQQIHEEIVADQKGVCSEQLRDKLELANVQRKLNQKLDDDLQEEILQLNFSELHFRNLIGPALSKDVMELSRHKLRVMLYQNRLEICDFESMSEKTLRDYCEMFKESLLFICQYLSIYEYYFGLALYHNYLGLLDDAHHRIQEAIINYETACSYLEQLRDILLQLQLSNEQTPYLSSRLENTYLFFADIFKKIGEIQCSYGLIQDGRTYLTKSMDIYSELFGTHSIKYVRVFCQIAESYKVENRALYVQMISDLYDSLECSENKESLLHISIIKFLVISDEGKDAMIHYLQIFKLLEEKVVMYNVRLLLQVLFCIQQFHLLAIAKTYQISQELSFQHATTAFDTIIKQDELTRSLNLIELVAVVQEYIPDNHLNYLILLNESRKFLKNQQYRIEIFKDERIEDWEFQIRLLKIEHWIVKIQLILFRFVDSNIDGIFCQIQTIIKHFTRIPKLQLSVIMIVSEFTDLMCILGLKDLSYQLIKQLTEMSNQIEDEATVKQIQINIIQKLLSQLSQI